jgi:DNA-binding MarR family transcriptional regulator
LEGKMGLMTETNRDLIILEHLEQDPDATQASLAEQAGVAVGTINWHIKRLVSKGYIKVRRAERRKLRYIITPEGLALRARLTVDYIQSSFHLYRLIRKRALEALEQVRSAGYDRVRIIGEGDLEEVCRLSCMEQQFQVENQPHLPCLRIQGLKVVVEYPDGRTGTGSATSGT